MFPRLPPELEALEMQQDPPSPGTLQNLVENVDGCEKGGVGGPSAEDGMGNAWLFQTLAKYHKGILEQLFTTQA